MDYYWRDVNREAVPAPHNQGAVGNRTAREAYPYSAAMQASGGSQFPTLRAQLPPLQVRAQEPVTTSSQSLPSLRAVLNGPSSSATPAQATSAPFAILPYPTSLAEPSTAYHRQFAQNIASYPSTTPLAYYNAQLQTNNYARYSSYQQNPHAAVHMPHQPDPSRPPSQIPPHLYATTPHSFTAAAYTTQPRPSLQPGTLAQGLKNFPQRAEQFHGNNSHSVTPAATREASVNDSVASSPRMRASSPIINQPILRVQPQIPAALGTQVEDGRSSDLKVVKKRKATPIERPIKRSKVCTRLGAKKPVQTFVPIDIWLQIFRFVEPKQLFEMRNVCKEFYNCLKNKQMPWRECRIAYFGTSIPPPPSGLKAGREEQMYMDLLAGHTQSCMSCGQVEENRKARKVYWAFLRRWCESCFKEKTVNFSLQDRGPLSTELFEPLRRYPSLWKCLMYGTVDSWGAYMFAGSGTQQLRREGARGWQGVLLKDDVQKKFKEIEDYVKSEEYLAIHDDNRERALSDWIDAQHEQVKLRLEPINQIEEYCKMRALTKIDRNAQLKKAREEFFIRRAALMEGRGMSRAELELVPAYSRSINIPKEPNQKAWLLLEKKLLQVRDEVRALINREIHANDPRAVERHVQYQNSGQAQDTIKFIEWLAETAWRKLQPTFQRERMDETDLTIAILNAMHQYHAERYERASQGHYSGYPPHLQNFARQPLTLEDICTTYAYLERTHFQRAHGLARHPDHFNCPGCCREDVKKRYLPKDLFQHIRTAHARGVGDFVKFRQMGPFEGGASFLFLVEWPRNLPMLCSRTRSKDGKWNANDNYRESYQGIGEVEPSTNEGGKGKRKGGWEATVLEGDANGTAAAVPGLSAQQTPFAPSWGGDERAGASGYPDPVGLGLSFGGSGSR